jgi:hypothetical protein
MRMMSNKDGTFSIMYCGILVILNEQSIEKEYCCHVDMSAMPC